MNRKSMDLYKDNFKKLTLTYMEEDTGPPFLTPTSTAFR